MRHWTGGPGDTSEHAAGLDPAPVPSADDVAAMMADLGPVALPTDAEGEDMARWYGQSPGPRRWGALVPKVTPDGAIPF